MVSTPYCSTTDEKDLENGVIVIASDGLWDVMTDQVKTLPFLFWEKNMCSI